MSEKKLHAREKFKEYVEETLGWDFSQVNAAQLSNALVRFYIEKIHNCGGETSPL